MTDAGAIKIGEEFGRLTVVRRVGLNKLHQLEYLARCDCGKLLTVRRADLYSGEVVSCGCPLKAPERSEPELPFSFDYTVVEFFERRARGKIEVVARDGRILDQRPLTRNEQRRFNAE